MSKTGGEGEALRQVERVEEPDGEAAAGKKAKAAIKGVWEARVHRVSSAHRSALTVRQ